MSEENLIQEIQKLNDKIEGLEKKLDKILPNPKNSATYYLALEDLRNPVWPEAVDPSMICDVNSEEDKIERANSVLDLYIEENIKNKKFLDFGCGEGHIVSAAEDNKAAFAMGYDIKDTFSENLKQKLPNSFTTDWDKVAENGPYDIILFYDVFDHVEKESEIQVLEKLKNVLSDSGKIYARMHPWTSRHGGHLYHEINKAFVHIALTETELEDFIGKKVELKVNKHFYPMKKYRDTISSAGLKIITENPVTQELDQIIKDSLIVEKIKKDYSFLERPNFQMTLNFVDYILDK